MLFGIPITAFAKANYDIDSVLNDTALYLYKAVPDPQVGQIGGEWVVLGLARCGIDIPDKYYADYYKNVEEYVKKQGGKLHNKKYTEYSRVIIALTSIGKDPSDVAGYNLLTPLGDYEKTVWQGINGAIFALIALDCGSYDIPENTTAKVQATREMYVSYILEKQTPDGGWALSGDLADADVTAMALQALSKYRDDEKAESATIVARGLGLVQKETAVFNDVTSKDWFFGYVGTAYHYGIIKGVSQNKFNPNGTITREEAAVMLARAAKLCGHNTALSDTEVRKILAGFTDYKKASDWSKESIAFCCKTKILEGSVMKINPKEAVTRGEIAGMLYNLLSNSKLL